MERLSHLILEEVVDKRWKPIKASRGGPYISHLMFAYDLQFFAKASLDQVDVVKQYLAKFEQTSGQKVSFAKSIIYISHNVAEDEAKVTSMTASMI